jgi:hypothetical protein
MGGLQQSDVKRGPTAGKRRASIVYDYVDESGCKPCRKSTALLACDAAVKTARLSDFRTFSRSRISWRVRRESPA